MKSKKDKPLPLEKEKGAAGKRLLEAAIDVFGEVGYTAATTRMIANRAHVNIAAIPYYFKGKEGLYHAVIEHIAAFMASELKGTLNEIETRLDQGDVTAEQAVGFIEKMLGQMAEFIIGSPEAPRFSRIMLREQLFPSSAYDIFFHQIMSPFLNAASMLIAVATDKKPARETGMRAMALFGQVLAFRVARETMVRALGVEGYSTSETKEIRRVILEHTRAALDCKGKTKE